MIDEVKQMLDSHLRWLKDSTRVKDIGDTWVEVTTPYLDRHNDMLQYYVRRSGAGFLLTDGGEIIEDLAASGCKLDSEKRKSLLSMTLRGFGITNNEGSLEVKATTNDFPLKQHSLIQAMLAVNDLFYLSKPVIQSIFLEDVAKWMESHDIRYTENISLTGNSGFHHHFEFIVPKSKNQPERIVETINHATKQATELLAFKWMDTRDARPQESRAFAILNDQEENVPAQLIDALANYDILAISWSERQSIVERLAA